MLVNSSTNHQVSRRPPVPLVRRLWLTILLPAWVLGAFLLAQLIVTFSYFGLEAAGVAFSSVNSAVLNTSLGAVIYALTIGLVIGGPWLVLKRRTTLGELGLQRWPSWKDLLITPLGFLVYAGLSAGLIAMAQQFLPFINFDQKQEIGFDQLGQQFEYVLAFLTLVVIAPVAEEVLFRGYLFGKLRKYTSLWIAILITSVLFALVHFAWNVGIDVFALSVILCLLTVWSKSLWPAILLHMLKNFVAFYFLFINPHFLTTLGG